MVVTTSHTDLFETSLQSKKLVKHTAIIAIIAIIRKLGCSRWVEIERDCLIFDPQFTCSSRASSEYARARGSHPIVVMEDIVKVSTRTGIERQPYLGT